MPRPRKAIRARIRPSGLYQVQFAEDPGHWYATGQDNSQDALAWARRKRGEILAPAPVLFKDAARGFFDDGSAWARRQEGRGRTFSSLYLPQMRGRLKKYLLPRWGETPIREITRRDFDDWIISVPGIKRSTKNKIIDAALILFREWTDLRLLPASPLDGLTHLIPSDMESRAIFSREELGLMFPADRAALEAIWANPAKGHAEAWPLWVSFFVALKDTGARPAELLALTWGDWRPGDCGFAIHKAVENTTGRIKPSTKTGSRKPVYLSARGVQELMLWGATSEHALPGDLIWSFDGRVPVKTDSAAKHFRVICNRAGINRGNRTPYCLRHTAATLMLETMPLPMVQIALGHSAKAMTALTSYFHPTDAMIMRMGEGMREILEAKVWS
jgi:integrase